MLPLPNLDDRTFEQLVREARDLIPGLLPDWTDENAHDPGITLLEMLAWLVEMQQFELDQLNEEHEKKFLKLLGEYPRPRIPSTTSVAFSGASRPVLVPHGTLMQIGDFPFETLRPVTVLPDIERQVVVHTADGSKMITDDFESGSAPFYPFGPQAEVGARMEIVFSEPLPEARPLSLWIDLTPDLVPPRRIPKKYKDFTPSGKIEWLYWQETSDGGAWQPIDMERDESYGFHQSGPILFQIPPGAGAVTRLSAHLTEGEYPDPPMVKRLIWNEVFTEQGETHSVSECFGLADAAQAQEKPAELRFALSHALFRKGRIEVQVKRAEGGWLDVQEDEYEIVHEDDSVWLIIKDSLTVPDNEQAIRVIAISPTLDGLDRLGTGNGLSGQSFQLPFRPALSDSFQLQVGWSVDGSEHMVWYDWQLVHDFDSSDSNSFHYRLDGEEGWIYFSDGIHGAVPPASLVPNIRIIGYRTSLGEAGNIIVDKVYDIDSPVPLRAINLFPAYGGKEPETTKEALDRTKRWVLQPNCGVTAGDLEQRVREIPGLRLSRVKAIPGYKTSLKRYPEERAFGHVSIVIVPESKKLYAKPAAGMIETVRTHLEPYRLLTTTLHIIPPEYVEVTVRAVIMVDPRYEGREDDVKQVLNRWLKPKDDEHSAGWQFGRTVQKSDVYDLIHQVAGVQYIQDMWLMADGRNVLREEDGDIRIPPHALVVSGNHEIEFITAVR